jgi:sugar/nucleoside kinase (ribokinase family)
MAADRSGATRVLVAGDANPDLILTGDVMPRFGQAEQLLDGATLTIGGSASITAHAFARLGRPVSLVAALGTDAFGDGMCRDLAAAGVDLGPVLRRRDAPTGLTVVLAQPHDRAILTMPGAIPTLTAAEIVAAVTATELTGLRHLHVSSLYLQPGIVTDLPELLADVRSRGVSTSLDTNDDPSGTWRGVDALLPHLDVLLPNRSEVIALAGVSDPRQAAGELAARGPIVVVKDGACGAYAATPSGQLLEQAAQVCTPIDTTGAGDTFGAAFVDAWLAGRPLETCLRRATAAGAFAVAALGGTSGQPTARQLDEAAESAATTTPGRNHDH